MTTQRKFAVASWRRRKAKAEQRFKRLSHTWDSDFNETTLIPQEINLWGYLWSWCHRAMQNRCCKASSCGQGPQMQQVLSISGADIMQTPRKRPESAMVALPCHASKYKLHKLHQSYMVKQAWEQSIRWKRQPVPNTAQCLPPPWCVHEDRTVSDVTGSFFFSFVFCLGSWGGGWGQQSRRHCQ